MTGHPTTPTLDPDRTDRLRAFLTEEARADLAAAPPRTTGATAAAEPTGDGATVRPLRTRPRVPRLAVAAAAVVLLAAGGLVASSFVRGGPAGSPAAVAFQDEGDGWTRITLTDVAADADQVVAELQAKGFDARKEIVAPNADGTYGVETDGGSVSGVAVAGDGAGPEGQDGRVGLSVSFETDRVAGSSISVLDEVGAALGGSAPEEQAARAAAEASEATGGSASTAGDSDVSALPEDVEDPEDVFEQAGVRSNPQDPTTMEVRDGAEVTIVVLVFT